MFQAISSPSRAELSTYPSVSRNGATSTIDPHNLVMREKYMGSLQTRWGGSQEQMLAFLNECRSAGLSAADLRVLESYIIGDRAWVHQFVEEDFDAAARDYLRSNELNPNEGCLFCAADAFTLAKEYADVVDTYSKILASDPTSAHALVRRGWAYIQLQRPNDAVADFARATELGDPAGEVALARMYLTGTSVAQDRSKGIELLQTAAAKNYMPAQNLLQAVLENIWPVNRPPQK